MLFLDTVIFKYVISSVYNRTHTHSDTHAHTHICTHISTTTYQTRTRRGLFTHTFLYYMNNSDRVSFFENRSQSLIMVLTITLYFSRLSSCSSTLGMSAYGTGLAFINLGVVLVFSCSLACIFFMVPSPPWKTPLCFPRTSSSLRQLMWKTVFQSR